MTPTRIQQRRTKGWTKPAGAKSVTRPGKFGNPFQTAAEFESALHAIQSGKTAHLTDDQRNRMQWIYDNLDQLRGKDLMCYCGPDAHCHADVLIRWSNRTQCNA